VGRAPFARRTRVVFILVAFPTAFLLCASPRAESLEDPSPEKVDAIFSEWDKPRSPGCALGVIRKSRFIYQKGYGMANLDWDIPITPSTVFYVGSVSKQFTAAGILLLAREGKLSLDDDIRKYLPEMPAYEAPVTVRHLVHHTSGVRDIYAVMDLAGLRVADVFSDEDALTLLAGQRSLNFKPGDEFLYSNGGYFLLSEIVERSSGKSFSEYTRQEVFGPLGMKDSHFHNDASHIVKRRALSYAPDGAGGFEQNYLGNFNKVGPGGLYTTVDDLLPWDENFYENRIGGDGFTDALLTRGVLNNGEELDYAFGIRDTEYQGLRVISHSGGMMGFRADVMRFPEERFSVMCLCNLGNIVPGELTRKVANLYLADRFRGGLEEYAGSYRSDDLQVTYDIVFRDGALHVDRPTAPDGSLAPAGEDRFRVYRSWILEFVRDGGSRISGFTVNMGRAKGVQFVREAPTGGE